MKKLDKWMRGFAAAVIAAAFTATPLTNFSTFAQAEAANIIKTDGAFTITTVQNEDALAENYQQDNRNFAAMATVEVTGNRLWSAWMSGGDKEPHNDNYIIVAYSDDKGETWIDPYMILDDVSAGRTRDPIFWYAPTGELYLFFGGSGGTRLIKFYNPEGDVSQVTHSEVLIPFSGTILNKPIVTSKGEWMCSADPYDAESAYQTEYVYVSTNQGESWTRRGTIQSNAESKQFHEGTIVEKNDGTLWVLSRIERGSGGGIEQAFSSDDGATWTTFEAGLPHPLIGPGSKCAIRKLQNGGLLFVSNNSTSARVDMTAYYSADDGVTWSALLLDSRSGDSAYPDIAEGADGTIYVIWDHSRSVKCEIRMARFTISDVKNGAFESEGAGRPCVTKRAGYPDILSLNTEFERNIYLEKGAATTKAELLASLPTAISVTLDNGKTQVVSGSWATNWFSTDYEGVYRFVFTPDDENLNLQDMGDFFMVRVIVEETAKEEKGCGSVLNACGGGLALAGLVLLKKKRR